MDQDLAVLSRLHLLFDSGGTVPESLALVAGPEDMAMIGQAIEQ